MRHFVVVFLLFLFGLFLVRTLLMEKLCLPVEYLLLVSLNTILAYGISDAKGNLRLVLKQIYRVYP